jgi:hypothetical protein
MIVSHPRAGRPIEAAPVKYIVAVLAHDSSDLTRGPLPALERLLGPVDFHGEPHPFGKTDYYEDEMGADLVRTLFTFEKLRPATDLVRVKLAVAETERSFEAEGGRRYNIDPGYIDFFKLVLASFKEGPQKIYLGDGVWADPVMMYQDGVFHALPWTFPDFKAGIYTEELTAIRRLYKAARRGSDRAQNA